MSIESEWMNETINPCWLSLVISMYLSTDFPDILYRKLRRKDSSNYGKKRSSSCV